MGFWIWMFIVAILCPTIMIVSGLYFRKSAPRSRALKTLDVFSQKCWNFSLFCGIVVC